jgi:hypothetical protein
MQALGWGVPAERFAWAAVEFGGDGVEVVAGEGGQIGALGEELAEQAVGGTIPAGMGCSNPAAA